MLAESEAITERSQWRKMRTLFERDPRSRVVEGGASQREEWFNEHVKALTVRKRRRRRSHPVQTLASPCCIGYYK